MKKYVLLAVVLMNGIAVMAGNGSNTKEKEKESTKMVYGKVIDKSSGEEIAGAEIKIGDKVFYTDLGGNFSASIPSSKTSAVIKFISYQDSQINIDPFSYSTIVVELVSK